MVLKCGSPHWDNRRALGVDLPRQSERRQLRTESTRAQTKKGPPRLPLSGRTSFAYQFSGGVHRKDVLVDRLAETDKGAVAEVFYVGIILRRKLSRAGLY